MSNRIQNIPTVSNQSHLSSTSRHQLKNQEIYDMNDRPQTLKGMKLKWLIKQLINKIKFLSPPHSLPFPVPEEWENTQDDNNNKQQSESLVKETLTQEVSNRYQFVKFYEVLEGTFILFFCWMVSVSIIFGVKILLEVSIIMSLLIGWKLIGKMAIAWTDREKQNTYSIYLWQDFMEPILLLGGSFLMIFRDIWDISSAQYMIACYQFVCVFLQIRGIGRHFQFLTLYAEQNKKRKELRIIELFCFTIAMAHLFALTMYAISLFPPPNEGTWIDKANLTGQPWYILYIYAYYWANTTMVTVGYGDITPNNYREAIVVTLIQMVGTAIFGYMINVIGITVNEIQKKNLQFQQHQSTIFKLKEHYQLSRQLCYKMKHDIHKKQSQMKGIPLKNNQEKQFLQYIDPLLKDEFVLQTNMKVIKKSIFFLTHFSVNFQNEIALKLIRCIYRPEDLIQTQQQGERQLVIINSGRVNIYAKKWNHNLEIDKLVRVISPQEGKPTLNVIGYSSLILNREVKLKAVAKDTSTAYILKREDVEESISKSMLDFESFNELRQKMQQSQRLQEIEAPAVRELEKHFIPNAYLILKKIKYLNQERIQTSRSKRRCKRSIITMRHYQDKTLLMIASQHKLESEYGSSSFIGFNDQEVPSVKCLKSKNLSSKNIVLDQAKIFSNFLIGFNINVVSQNYERYCLKKTYRRRLTTQVTKKSTKKWMREA